MIRLCLLAVIGAGPALAQDGGSSARDPAAVYLPPNTRAQLTLGSNLPFEVYGQAFDAMAGGGAIFLAGPGTTPQISAAADRARVFLAYMQYDLDGDGAVSRAEYDLHADVTWGLDLDEEGRRILDEEWVAADQNRDGIIALLEVQNLASAAIPAPEVRALSAVEAAIMGMDLDNDSFIRWDEVEAVLKAQE